MIATTSAWLYVSTEIQEHRSNTSSHILDALAEQYRLDAIGPFHGPPSPPLRPQLVDVTGRPAGAYRGRKP